MFVPDPLQDAALRGVILVSAGLVWVIVLTRMVGLRSFSKMTAFDFIMTLATGSLLATAGAASDLKSFVQPMAAITTIFVVQVSLAWMRQRSDGVRQVLDNKPQVLMRRGVMDHEALRRTRVASADVIAKLREANALDLDEVSAVVLEATGDISVLHGGEVDEVLLEGVKRAISVPGSGGTRG